MFPERYFGDLPTVVSLCTQHTPDLLAIGKFLVMNLKKTSFKCMNLYEF